jgi:HAD domain family 1 in Swiss Army Knife RNA repair proteins
MELPGGLAAAMRLDEKAGPVSALHIFDFDNTLIRTPEKEAGCASYLASTGQPWRWQGWWGREESLSEHVLPSPLPRNLIVRTVFDELEEVSLRSHHAAAVIATGRLKKLRPAVLRILDDAACVHTGESESFIRHESVFTKSIGAVDTLEFKTRLMETLVTGGPEAIRNVQYLHIWEDRIEHAKIFSTEFSDALYSRTGIEVIVHFVGAETP